MTFNFTTVLFALVLTALALAVIAAAVCAIALLIDYTRRTLAKSTKRRKQS